MLAKPENHLHQYVPRDGIARASTAVLQFQTARTFTRRHSALDRPAGHPRIFFAAEAVTVITPPQLKRALELIDPQASHPARDISRLADRANQELAAWGHAGHELTLERVSRLPGEPGALGCLIWCEGCHVSQLLVLPEPGVR